MAKAHGKKARVYAGGIDLSTYLRMAKRSGDQDLADSSTFALDDKTFVVGMQSGTFGIEGIYSARPKGEGALEVADLLQTNLGGDTPLVAVHLPQGDGFGNVAYLFEGHRNSIEVTSPYDDVVKISGEAQSNVGFKRGLSFHPKGEEAETDEGEAIDHGAATEFGGMGILQVTGIEGTPELDVKIQHSADDETYADLITFTSVTAAEVAEAITLAAGTKVNKFVRAVWSLSEDKATFSVTFARNLS